MLAISEVETTGKQSQEHQERIAEALDHILRSPRFKDSQQLQSLLQYVVDKTVKGNNDSLKERIIGISVFGRRPDYDTTNDPIVRTRMGLLRKRLAQYYEGEDREQASVQIVIPNGTYRPGFVFQPLIAKMRTKAALPATKTSALPALAAAGAVDTQPRASVRAPTGEGWKIALALIVFILGIAAGAAASRFYLRKQPRPIDLLQRYWGPVYGTAEPVLFCVETERSPVSGSKTLDGRYILLDDVTALMRVATGLTRGGKAYHVRAASDVPFEQLRSGPYVLIGFSDNPWTQRLSQGLPFSFQTQGTLVSIVDNRDPRHSKWENQEGLSEFAILARVRDATTRQAGYIVAGLTPRGTEGASSLLATPDQVARLLVNRPVDWGSQNFEAVIRMSLVDGRPGAPTIVRTAYWPDDPK